MIPSGCPHKLPAKKCLSVTAQQHSVRSHKSCQLESTEAMSRILSSRVVIERLSVHDIASGSTGSAGAKQCTTEVTGVKLPVTEMTCPKQPTTELVCTKLPVTQMKIRQNATPCNRCVEMCDSKHCEASAVHNGEGQLRVIFKSPSVILEEGSLFQGRKSSCNNVDMQTAACDDWTDSACVSGDISHPCEVISQEEFCGLFGLVTQNVLQKLKTEGHKMHRSAGGKLRHNVKSRLTPELVLRRARMTKQSFVPGVSDADILSLAQSAATQVTNGMEKAISKQEKREWLRPPARRSLDDSRALSTDNLDHKKLADSDLNAMGARRSQRRGAVERRRWHHLLRGREDEDDSWERRRTPTANHRREDMETDGEESKGASDATGASSNDIDWSQSSDVVCEAADKRLPITTSRLMMISRMIKSQSEPQITSFKKKRRGDESEVKTSPLHRSPKRTTVEAKDKVKDNDSGRVKPASLECLVPHMCRICWINDHMYCKNMKRIARDLPPCGGCLHYVPCEHYRHLRESYLSTAVSTVVMRPFETLLNPLPQPMVSSSDDEEDTGVSGGKDTLEVPVKYATCADDLLCHEIMLDSDHEHQHAEGTELLSAQLKARAVRNHPRTASRQQAKKTGRQSSPKREEQVVQVCDYGAEVILDVSGRNLTKEVKPLPLPIDSGRKSMLGCKRDESVVVMPIKSSVLLNKTSHSHAVSRSHEAATSLLHLKRGSGMHHEVQSRRGRVEEGEERRAGSRGRADDNAAVKLAAVNSDMLGTLIVRKAMSLLHTRQPQASEEDVEEEGDSITVVLSNSPEMDEEDMYLHSQPLQTRYAPVPSVLRKAASLPLPVRGHSPQQPTALSRAHLPGRAKTVHCTAAVKVESDDIVSHTVNAGVRYSTALAAPLVIKSESDEAQVEYMLAVRKGVPVTSGQADNQQLWIKPEPEDDYGNDVAIDIFAEVDADGTVRTSEGRRQWHAGEIVCDGEVELSTETVLN